MPIKGLTDRTDLARFNRLGKIRKGGEKGEKGGFGEDLSYFRFVADGGPEREGVLNRAWAKCYGAQPASLIVTMPYQTVDECFPCWQEQWSASAMLHRCDGETMVMWLKDDKRSYSRDPRPCPYANIKGAKERTRQDPGCKPQGRLEVFLPQLLKETGFAPAVVTLETSSLHDIASITGVLQKTAAECDWDLTGQAFIIYRVLKHISTPGEAGKRVRRAKWLVKIDPVQRRGTPAIESADYEEPLGLPPPEDDGEPAVSVDVLVAEGAAVPTVATINPQPRPPTGKPAIQMPRRKPGPKAGSLRKVTKLAQPAPQPPPQPVPEPERPKTPTPEPEPVEQPPEQPPAMLEQPPQDLQATTQVFEPADPQVDSSQDTIPLAKRTMNHKAMLFGNAVETAGVTGETLTELVQACTLYDKTFGKEAAKSALGDLFPGMVTRRFLTEPEGKRYLRHVTEALEAFIRSHRPCDRSPSP